MNLLLIFYVSLPDASLSYRSSVLPVRWFCRYAKGILFFSGPVSRELGKDPLKGEVFIFLSSSARQIKILCFEGDGFDLYQKKLERGTFERPQVSGSSATLSASELRFLMEGIVLKSIERRVRYEQKKPSKKGNNMVESGLSDRKRLFLSY